MGVGATYIFVHSTAKSEFGGLNAANELSSLTLWEGNFSVLPVNQRDDLAIFRISAQSGNSQWTLFFNTVDLDLGRAFFLNPRLIVRLHFDLKGSWMKQ